MWRKFKKINDDGKLPEISNDKTYIRIENAVIWREYHSLACPMVGVLPSGKIINDLTSPECEPYFLITFSTFSDVVTDGEKYSWIYNTEDNSSCYYVGDQCKLAAKPMSNDPKHDAILTTRDARIIKALIKLHLKECETENVA